MHSDSELLDLLKSGREEAFTELYHRHWKLIYAHVYKMLRNEEDAKDIIQEVFSSLWSKAGFLRAETNISGWLFIAARNRVFDLIAKNKVRFDYLGEIAAYIENAAELPIETIDERKIEAILEREIQNLPAKMREIFEMSRKEHLSHKEIALKLNLSEQTVKKQVQNALKLLKPKLKNLGLGISLLVFIR